MNKKSTKSIIGIVLKIILCLVIAGAISFVLAGAKSALDIINTFFYFTIQSNLILLVVTLSGIIALVRRKPQGRFFSMLSNGSLLWILLTGLVYHFMLSGAAIEHGYFTWTSVALHYNSPGLAVINWLFFEEKGRNRFIHTVYWIAYPLCYVGLTQFRLALDEFFFPYWFLNPLKPFPDGTGSVWLMLAIVGGLVVIFGGLGALIIALDRLMARRIKTAN